MIAAAARKEIWRKASRRWRERHPEAARKKRRRDRAAYYIAHREATRTTQATYRAAHREEIRAQSAARYLENKQTVLARRRARVALRQAFVDAARAGGCVDCGNKNLNVLDSDHVRGRKVGNVSLMATRAVPFANLFAELDKCETVCANCHRIRTNQRRLTKLRAA